MGLKENYGDAPTRSSNQCDDLCFHLNIIQALDRQMDGRTVMVIQYCALRADELLHATETKHNVIISTIHTVNINTNDENRLAFTCYQEVTSRTHAT